MNILIVEDDPVSASLLGASLEIEGNMILTAHDGVEAFKIVEGNIPIALIIADVKLPKMDGFTLLSMVKNNPKYKAIQFVVYTSFYTDSSHETLAYQLGADMYIRKSGHTLEILKAVKSMLPKVFKEISNPDK